MKAARAALCALACTLVLTTTSTAAAQKQVVGSSTPTLSTAVRWGDMLFLSGALGVSRTAPDSTVGGQTKMIFDNMKTTLESAGTNMANVVKCTVFLVDLKDFGPMNTAYATAFSMSKEPPARSTVVVAALVSAAAKVEIECIAGIPKP